MSLKCGVGYGYRLICFTLWGVGMWCVLTWAVSVGVMILVPFGYYFTADLEYGFLRDKREFFSVAVTSLRSMHTSWVHQSLSSVAFISGTLQVDRTLREQCPRLHRWLGRFYCVSVLLAASPGGLVMGFWAYGGLSSQWCFLLLAGLTWVATFSGWRHGYLGNVEWHAKWMIRSYVLLASAICLWLLHLMLSSLKLNHELTYQLSV